MRALTPALLLLLLAACKDSDGPLRDSTPDNDRDGDGYAAPADCDDEDPGVHPSATEVCDGADNDCDGNVDGDAADLVLSYADEDGDGHGDPLSPQYTCEIPDGAVLTADDCDDTDPTVYTGAPEWCDGVDDDCDGVADDEALDILIWSRDADGDGYGDPIQSRGIAACEMPFGYTDNADDCDDSRADVNPGAAEVCDPDDTDEDCDGAADGADADGQTLWYPDLDQDGSGGAGPSVLACDPPAGWVDDFADCDDTRADVNPGATEVCDPDDTDEDCDGLVNDADPSLDTSTGEAWYPDVDQDGFGDEGAAVGLSCLVPTGAARVAGDCDDADAAVNPDAAEVCNGVDDDCDGDLDDADADVDLRTGAAWYADGDGDGYGSGVARWACADPSAAGADYATRDGDCDDGDAAISPGAVEICDAFDEDEDCDGVADDDDPDVDLSAASLWFPDADADGYGSATHGGDWACDDPSTASVDWLHDDSDCDDASAAVNPLGTEACNGVDDDCDGVVDNDETLLGGDAACPGYSCLDILDLRTSTPSSGFYYIDADGNGSATRVYCDMSTDGGGYTFLKVSVSSAYYASNAESYCTALGMQLFVPRSLNHRNAALAVARSAAYGGTASDGYLYILGIYPDYGTGGSGFNGAKCIRTALNSSACTLWGPSDGGPYYVSARTDVTEPNGDNDLGSSMYYTWSTSDVSWYNDVPTPGYASASFICDVGDKWGAGLTRP